MPDNTLQSLTAAQVEQAVAGTMILAAMLNFQPAAVVMALNRMRHEYPNLTGDDVVATAEIFLDTLKARQAEEAAQAGTLAQQTIEKAQNA